MTGRHHAERSITTRFMAFAAGSVLALGSTVFAQTTPVLREGEGTRRTELNAMELRPFPVDLFTKLSDWKNGTAITEADIAGKPVLIFTWNEWYAPAKRAMAGAQKLSEKYSKDGLIVIGVHNPEGWADSAKPAPAADCSLLLAHDATGEFRKGLKIDQDPDCYLIDRAGQLRYADVKNESLDAAIAELIAEKADVAAGVKGRLEADAKQKDLEARRTEALRGGAKFTEIPEQEFTPPSPNLYKDADWPPLPRDPNNPNDLGSQIQTKAVVLPANDWYPSKPETKGRMIILYFWSPVFTGTYYETMPFADQMQTQFGRDAVVIGVMTPFDNVNGYTLKEEDRDPQKLVKRMKEIAQSRDLKHYLVADPSKSVFDAVTAGSFGNEILFPFWAIVSSDNSARWWTTASLTSPWGAMQRIIEVDPGIKARRDAEAAWLKKNQ